MREREEQNLRQLETGSRILASAVLHEVRNLCGAFTVVYANLKHRDGPCKLEDLEGLDHLMQGLARVTAFELRRKDSSAESVSIQRVLDELRIIIEPAWWEFDGQVRWNVPAQMPRAAIDRHALLQVFLNVAQNSARAVADREIRELQISVTVERQTIGIRFLDTGPGVRDVSSLFQPFQEGAASSGLGLYISRAMVRNFGGELRHVPSATGACFPGGSAGLAGPGWCMSFPGTGSIRLLIVDDHAMFREGIAELLAKTGEFIVAGSCASVEEAMELLAKARPTIVVLDFDLGVSRAFEFLERARAAGFTGRVLILTAGVSEPEAVLLVQAGVAGILHKHHTPDVLRETIRKVAAGEVCLESHYLKPLFRKLDQTRPGGAAQLSPRERQILRLVFQGLANKEIGARVELSEGAVKSALRQLFQKLGVRTRAQLVKVALEEYRDQLQEL